MASILSGGGGEEFIIYYRELDVDSAYEQAKSLCQRISETIILPGKKPVTVTIGIACGKQSEFDSVVKKADEKLYYGKSNGKNQVVI